MLQTLFWLFQCSKNPQCLLTLQLTCLGSLKLLSFMYDADTFYTKLVTDATKMGGNLLKVAFESITFFKISINDILSNLIACLQEIR